jgi:polysaccharide pyruvyl transferase WcaK-like protein
MFASDIMDVYALEDLRKRLLARTSSAVAFRVTFRPVLTLKELLLQMSSFDFVVTSKFHGVIFSHLLGKPVIALSYLPKIGHLMRTVGHERYCIDAEHFDADWLIERFQLLVHESDQLRSLFRKISAAYAHALHTEFDKLFLPESSSLAHEDYGAGVGRAGSGVSHVAARQ